MFKSVNSNAQFLKVIYFQKLVSLKESYSFLNLLCDLIFYFNPIQKLWIISWSISEWFYRLSCEFYFGSETMWNIKSCLTFLTTGNFLFIKEILFNYKIKKRKKKIKQKNNKFRSNIFLISILYLFFFFFFPGMKFLCKGKNHGALFQYPGKPSYYVQCNYGLPSCRKCPKNLVFVNSKRVCARSHNWERSG